MTISRKLTSITTAIALAVASLGTVTTSASAGGYRGDGYGGGHYSRGYDPTMVIAVTTTAAAATATTPATTRRTTPASTSPSAPPP